MLGTKEWKETTGIRPVSYLEGSSMGSSPPNLKVKLDY